MLIFNRLALLAALCGLFSTDAFAGAGTVTGKDASGATHTWDVITDGSGNFVWMNGICDGTAAAQCAAVKAASTAAGATDPAMVVAVSPNNSVAITAASLPLPTGASTSAKQPALGTAGTASTDVLTVQGIASMTALAVSASALPLPTGAATSALQTTGNSTLTTINTTLGTPMQNTGGSVTANAGTNLNTSALATSANQTNANQKTQIVDGSGNVIASTSNNLNVQCANCSGSGASAADAATFTAGTSVFAPAGGQFTSGGATACVTGHQCMSGMTAARAIFTDTSSLAGTALGAPSNYGTSPGAVAVQGVNAFVTNANSNGSAVSASSSPVVIASDQAAVAIKAASASIASGAIASGAVASGAISSGAYAAGSIGSGAIASGAVASGAFASGAFAAGSFLNATAGDPCMFQLKSFAPVSITASGQIIAGTAAKKTYICSIDLIGTTAGSVALVEGTGTVCATNIFGLAGGTTAGTGWPFGATSGLVKGNGGGMVYFGSGDANATAANVCLLVSGTGQVSGTIGYIQQ